MTVPYQIFVTLSGTTSLHHIVNAEVLRAAGGGLGAAAAVRCWTQGAREHCLHLERHRRRDRTKLKRLGELGEVRFVNPYEPDEVAAILRGWPVFVVSSA